MAAIQGSIAWFNNAKGFGFISNEAGPDVFVHYSEVACNGYKSLKEGERVESRSVQAQVAALRPAR